MAGRFRFRLEVVRRVRQQARDAQRRVVAEAIRAVRAVEDTLRDSTQALHDTVERTRETQQARHLNLALVREEQFYRTRLHRRIIESRSTLAKKQAVLDREREKLANASKRLKVIEKLRDKRRERHLAQVRREEQVAFDETALQGYLRSERTRAVKVLES